MLSIASVGMTYEGSLENNTVLTHYPVHALYEIASVFFSPYIDTALNLDPSGNLLYNFCNTLDLGGADISKSRGGMSIQRRKGNIIEID
jgi:hypothetical protein